jgi:zinc protease
MSLNFLSEDFDTAFDLLEKFVLNPSFPADVIERKKRDILKAIKLRDEDIVDLTMDGMMKHLYEGHPYANDTLGTTQTVEALTRDDIVAYYNGHATASNMVLAVFGDFDQAQVMKRIEKLAARVPQAALKHDVLQVKALTGAQELTQSLNKQQAMVAVGFRGTDLFSADRYTLELIDALLGSSFSGRLFNSIREQFGESYNMGASSMPGFGTGHIIFYVLTDPSAAENVKAVLRKEIVRLRQEPLADKELADIKTYLKGRHKASLELNESLAFQSSLDELYGIGYDDHRSYDGRIDSITKEDVQRAAEKYLTLENAVTVVTRPEDK